MIEPTRHKRATLRLLTETVLVALGLACMSLWVHRHPEVIPQVLLVPLAIAQGIWLDRLYIVAHEGVHRKLLPFHPLANDILTTVLLLPIAAPLTIYRKIHHFHHGSNRRDAQTAALDHFVVRGSVSRMRTLYYRCTWIFYVFLGGFYVHSLVTILLFLVVPTRVLKRIDPVFNGWRAALRVRSWGEFACGVALHATIIASLGLDSWLVVLGWPIVVFAWVWSLLLYVYHYDTTVGTDVRYNVRSLPRQRVTAWLFLNFNEHATHHRDPSVPWYLLPEQSLPLPERYASNQNVNSLLQAVLRQLRGPHIVTRDQETKAGAA